MHNVSVNEGGHVTLRGSQFLNANGAVALTTTHMAVQIWADDAPKMQDLVTNARRACGSGKLVRFQGPVQLKICDVPKFVPARGT